jgi:hypothetical protein
MVGQVGQVSGLHTDNARTGRASEAAPRVGTVHLVASGQRQRGCSVPANDSTITHHMSQQHTSHCHTSSHIASRITYHASHVITGHGSHVPASHATLYCVSHRIIYLILTVVFAGTLDKHGKHITFLSRNGRDGAWNLLWGRAKGVSEWSNKNSCSACTPFFLDY